MAPARLTLALLACLALFAGCQAKDAPRLPPGPAPPQRASLGWVERFPDQGPGLVFETRSFEVTASGWSADVAVENESGIAWRFDEIGAAAGSFGVMLFVTGDVAEVEERSREDDLPGLRPAQDFVPPLPARLVPGATWSGTISAPGPLAAGLHVRLMFGPFVAVGDPPDGMQTQFSWITDSSYPLRRR